MRRFVLAIIVGMLTFSASGIQTLVAGEPCSGYEEAGSEDGACAPTCVTCGCCAQAAEPVSAPTAPSLAAPVAGVDPLDPRLANTSPRDILHVPKRHGA